MILCVCKGVTARSVEAAVAAGARDLEAIALATGAGTDCGCCRGELGRRLERTAPCSSPPCPGCPRAGAPGGRAA